MTDVLQKLNAHSKSGTEQEVDMTTVHLPMEVEAKLVLLAEKKQKSKSDIIKEALNYFFHKEESERDSYQLGEEYFGQYGSGDGALSVSYKQKLKEKIHARIDSH